MARSKKQGKRQDKKQEEEGHEGWLRRLRDLSLLAKSVATLAVALALLTAAAFGSGTVRVSGSGIEFGPRDAAGEESDRSGSVQGDVFFYLLQPGVVRICPAGPIPSTH